MWDNRYEIIVLKPDIEEEWLGISKKEITKNMPDNSGSSYFKEINKRVGEINIIDLANKSKSFSRIISEIEMMEKYT